MAWEDAINQVLKEADGALHYSEIADRIVSQGLRKKVGATPASTVASHLSVSLKGDNSPYLRIGRGEYTLKESAKEKSDLTTSLEAAEEEKEAGALRSFGMFWQREFVYWKSARPSLFGRQGLGAEKVNFSEQIGVYLLHDRERVIYVGRSADGLGVRLRTHISDRLGGRWNRFSWFGLRSVDEKGQLSDDSPHWSQSVVIDTMEALLIESLEPPLNRKGGGDRFSGAEYLQVKDPKIERVQMEDMFKNMQNKLFGD
ncbi:HTH domain-containing protein [Microbaculum sp. FT89]|uniref:HTH domain-containing protein n=1 Tax=Microbaculum sp. FT89 TaxID=3447298 RepID=UPI003F53A60A